MMGPDMDNLLAGRYQVLDALGQGAHGTVYRVCDTWLNGRELALKTLNVNLRVTPTWQARFREEFRAMARLKHPHIVAVDDFGRLDDDHQYLTMECVPGQELSAMIGRPMALEQAYTYLSQLLSALELIHGRSYLHRDIKPANLRVTHPKQTAPFGQLKLIDFGLVSPLLVTAHGGLSGTPAYLAPEVITGQGGSACQDLYAVGCLAFEMLTGRPPFVGSTREVLQAHLQKNPPTLQEFRPDAPKRFNKWIARLLEKDPNRRYASAQEALLDLAGISGRGTVQVARNLDMDPLRYPPLIGRERQLTLFEEYLAESSKQGGPAIVLGGPSGSGKTRLLEEVALHAKLSGTLVLWIQGEQYACDPYMIYVRMIKQLAHMPDLNWEDSERQDMAAWWSALSQATTSVLEQDAILAMLERCLRQVALQHPLLLVLDDMHWFDEPSLRATNHLMRDVNRTNIAIIGSFQPEIVGCDSPIMHAIHEGFAHRHDILPLQEAEITDFLNTVFQGIDGAQYHARVLHQLSGGNPEFLIEYLRAMIAENSLVKVGGQWRFLRVASELEAPPSLSAVIQKRLAFLDEPARQLLEVASVAGQVWNVEMLRGLCQETAASGEEFDGALETLLKGQWLLRKSDECGTMLAIAQSAVQTAIYNELNAETRARLHDECLAHLERLQANETPGHLAELAHHAERGTDALKAYVYLERAGDHLHRAKVDNRASEHWQRGLKMLHRVGVAHHDPRCLTLLAKISDVSIILAPKTVAKSLKELLSNWLARPEDDEARLLATGRLASALGSCGAIQEALALAERLQTLAGDDGLRRGATCYLFIPALMSAGRIDEAYQKAEQAVEALSVLPLTGHSPWVGALIETQAALNIRAFQGLRPDWGHMERANAIAHQVGLDDPLYARFYPALWQAWSGRYIEAIQSFEALLKRSRQSGGQTFPWIQLLGSTMLWQRGEFELALQQSQRAIDMPYTHEIALCVLMLRHVMGQALFSLKRYAEGRQHFEALRDDARAGDFGIVALQAELGLLEISVKEPVHTSTAALERQLEALLLQTREGSLRNPLQEALTLRVLALLMLKISEPQRAQHALEQALDIVKGPEIDNWFEQGRLEFEKSMIFKALNRDDDALRARQRASELFALQRNPYWQHRVTFQESVPGGDRIRGFSPESRARLAKGLQF
jgi:tetratricopeptide (TPR) repeat protein